MEHIASRRRRRSGASLAACVALVMAMIAGACASNDSGAGSGDATNASTDESTDVSTDVSTSVSTTEPATATDSGSAASTDTATSVDDTSASDTSPPPASPPGSAVGTVPPLPADVGAALGGAGVAVIDAPEPSVTDAILTLTASQAQFMAEEATSGSGLLGASLDAAGGGTTQGLPVSAVLAGYVRGVDTAGAAYSRTLLAGQDLTLPEQVVFPTIVLALFAADAASAFAADDAGGESTGGSGPPVSGAFSGGGIGASRHARAAGICSDVTKSIFDAVDKIFAKIHIPPGRVGDTGSGFLNGLLQGLTNVVVAGLNFVIDAAKALIVDGIKFVLSQVLSIVAEVAAAAALVANIVSAVRPWKLDVTAKEPNTRKGIDPEKVYDQVTAKAIIIGPTDDWPEWFVDCAAVAGVTLPSLLPVDTTVTWTVYPYVAGLMTESADEIPKDLKLRKDGKDVLARIGLVTATESKDKADKGAEQHGAVLVTATARRDQIEELRKTLVTAAKNLANRVLASVPAIIRDFLLKLVDQAAEGGTEQVAALLDATGKALIDVKYHGPPEPETTVPAGGGAWSFAFYSNGSVAPSIAGYTCNGLASTWHVIFGAGSPELERTYDLPLSPSAMTAHHDLVYDIPPAGTSGAVHLEWRWDYFLDTSVSPPMIRITGTQHETPQGGSEYVFDNNFGTGEGIVVEHESLPELLDGTGLSHPFLDQAKAECG